MAFKCVLVAGLALLCVTGCKPSAEKAAARQAKVSQEIEALFAQIGKCQSDGQFAKAESLTEKALKNSKFKAEQARFFNQKIVLMLAQNQDTKIVAALNEGVVKWPDDQLLKMLRAVFPTLQKSNKTEIIEQTCKEVFSTATGKASSVNYVSRIWVESGVAANKKLLPERLDALLNAKVSPIQVGNLFDRYFYEMVADLDTIKKLCSLGERILAVCTDENTVNNVKVKVLDGAFITENYDLAVHMLEQGIPGKDKTWHEMSLPKVKAHRAMAQNKPREAVQYFRDFMNAWITSKQEEEFDPTSGIAYSREWILGRNANRIAGILDAVPDKDEADKARAEAKEYFRIAIQKASKDAEATKLLKEETKDMGL